MSMDAIDALLVQGWPWMSDGHREILNGIVVGLRGSGREPTLVIAWKSEGGGARFEVATAEPKRVLIRGTIV